MVIALIRMISNKKDSTTSKYVISTHRLIELYFLFVILILLAIFSIPFRSPVSIYRAAIVLHELHHPFKMTSLSSFR